MAERYANGDKPATRRDLALERDRVDDKFERLDERVKGIAEDVSEIREAIGAGPRWFGARANAVVDKILPTLIAIGALWVLTEGFR